ncbi:hypothetical protein MPL3356_40494 [Mesorhizobium plurifarium]|uniref:Uncharacterized protein n=1 Tax=Mesorhizobium plurifarium TaxID=69974 RepID=A0A090FXT7_MESPL|nr:hypothetical protein MPL3356_40494 [Mesorhizobium plurifarium]
MLSGQTACAPDLGVPFQFRHLEDIVAPGGVGDLPGQIAIQQKALFRGKGSRRLLMIQSKRMDQVPGQARDGEVNGHLQSPLLHGSHQRQQRPSPVKGFTSDP